MKRNIFVDYDKIIPIDLSHISTIHSVIVSPVCTVYWNSKENIYGYELRLHTYRVQDAVTQADYCYYEDIYHGMDQLEYECSIKFMYIHIGMLEYNHYNCKFFLFREKQLKEEELVRNIFHFRDYDSVTVKQDKCAICHEETISKTSSCKHHICAPCADKQILLYEEDIHGRIRAMCPVCRNRNGIMTLTLQCAT